MREIALDTETTGLDPATGHRIVEIGCVEMKGRLRTGNVFHTYLHPERDMPDDAFRIHGLSGEFLADKPLFAAIAQGLLDFIGDDPLIIHNAQFDLRFLNAELEAIGMEPLLTTRAIDTVTIARKKFPGSPANLDALCRRFNIDLSSRTRHGALLDAELLADVYLELTGGRQAAMLLEADDLMDALQEAGEAGIAIPIRHFPASEEELAAHRAFLAGIKDPLWESS